MANVWFGHVARATIIQCINLGIPRCSRVSDIFGHESVRIFLLDVQNCFHAAVSFVVTHGDDKGIKRLRKRRRPKQNFSIDVTFWPSVFSSHFRVLFWMTRNESKTICVHG